MVERLIFEVNIGNNLYKSIRGIDEIFMEKNIRKGKEEYKWYISIWKYV